MTFGIFRESGESNIEMPGISDRELGRLEQEFTNIKHRMRNQKLEIEFLVAEVREIRGCLDELRTRIHAIAAVVIVFGSAFAWLVDLFRS